MDSGIKTRIRQFILSNYMVRDSFLDTDSLLRKGLIDSMGVMELMAFIQKEYGIKVDTREVVPENFDTVSDLERFVLKKTGRTHEI